MKKQIYLMVVVVCLSLLTKAHTVIPSYVPTNGLVGWWPFNGNANDLSINANNGTVNGATLTADRYGNANKAYSFDGISNYINVTNNSSLNPNSITISGWVNSNADASDVQSGVKAIVTKWYQQINCNNLGDNYSVQLSFLNNQSVLVGATNSNNSINNSISSQSNLIGLNIWRHFVFIHDSNNGQKLYVDGSSINSNNITGNLCFTLNNLLFGADNFNGNIWRFFNGTIDDIGIWNRALTPCEVKKLYTSGSFSVSSSASNTICVGQSLNLTAAGATTYNWSTGATSQSISVSPTVSTVYTVTTTYSAGCTDSRTFSVTVNACTGLNEAELVINSVRIFPNPAKEQLNIAVNNNAVMGKKYSITNTLGQEVTSGIFNKQTTELNIQQLSAGLYQLNIEGLNENYKFIKE